MATQPRVVLGTEEFDERGFITSIMTESGERRYYKKPLSPKSFKALKPMESSDARRGNALTEDKWAAYLDGLEAGGRYARAARGAGISMDSVYNRRRNDPEFVLEEKRRVAIAADPVVDALYEAATVKKNVTAIIFWLQNQAPDEWKDMRANGKQTVTVEGGITHTQELGTGSLERIAALIERVEARERSKELPASKNPPVSHVIDIESTEIGRNSLEWE